VFTIVGAAMEIHNSLGHGFLEKPYENALVIEFGLRHIPYKQQPQYPIWYKEFQVGIFIPDLIAYDQIVIETKTIAAITDLERGKMLNYLKVTGCRVGLIIDFLKPKLEWERSVL
jgi:GxxExxY protein